MGAETEKELSRRRDVEVLREAGDTVAWAALGVRLVRLCFRGLPLQPLAAELGG